MVMRILILGDGGIGGYFGAQLQRAGATIGDILRTVSGESFITGLLEECVKVATAHQCIPNPEQLLVYRNQLSEQGSDSTTSMLRDIERGGPIESEHTIGDMVRRAHASGINVPLLKLAYSHLHAYELTRQKHVH